MAIGILLAAGMGTRMRPLTENTPKPLLKVGNTMLIETVIEALLTYGKSVSLVTDIYIVTGYLADRFIPLAEKYPEVHLVNNPEYETKNNLSSLYVVADKLRDENCFICEADLFIRNNDILNQKKDDSGYFAKRILGHSDDWVFDVNSDGRITRVGKGGTDAWNMVGLSYIKKKTAPCSPKLSSKPITRPEPKTFSGTMSSIKTSTSWISPSSLYQPTISMRSTHRRNWQH